MSELILYTSDDGRTRLDLRAEGDTVWLSQLEISELFQTTKQNVSLHAKNISSQSRGFEGFYRTRSTRRIFGSTTSPRSNAYPRRT